jgi:Domain of unknown function (DUF4160)
VPIEFRYRGIRFLCFSNEGNSREPIHIRALCGDAEAKFLLEPSVRVADSVGFSARAPGELVAVVESHRAMIEQAWHEHFG